MKIDAREMTEIAVAQPMPRHDLYLGIHKALRALMSDTLLAVGRMDTEDDLELAQTSERVVELLAVCAGHLKHENDFVHPALEARSPGTSRRIGHEHGDHEQHIAELSAAATSLLTCPRPARAGIGLNLYRRLALFIAENFEHMYFEETAHNAVLWACYSDQELEGLHNALVGSIPPEEMMHILRWMLPYLNPAERAGLLAGMQAQAPAEVFSAVLAMLRPHLSERDWAKLARSLALPAVAGLTA